MNAGRSGQSIIVQTDGVLILGSEAKYNIPSGQWPLLPGQPLTSQMRKLYALTVSLTMVQLGSHMCSIIFTNATLWQRIQEIVL